MEKKNTKKPKYHLSISQFAMLCHTTRDTLRHYEDSGLLIPRVDDTNGYRYYSPAQASTFFYIRSFSSAGWSLKEIYNLMHNFSRDQVISMANKKMIDMQQELLRITNNIAALNMSLWLLNKYDKHRDNKPFIDSLDKISIIKTPVPETNDARYAGDMAELLMQHFDAHNALNDITVFPTGASIAYNDLVDGNYVYNNIITLSAYQSSSTNSNLVPSRTALCCYHDHEKEDIEITYKKLVQYVEKNKLKVCSDLNIINFINLYNAKKRHTYFKFMFMCIKDK